MKKENYIYLFGVFSMWRELEVIWLTSVFMQGGCLVFCVRKVVYFLLEKQADTI